MRVGNVRRLSSSGPVGIGERGLGAPKFTNRGGAHLMGAAAARPADFPPARANQSTDCLEMPRCGAGEAPRSDQIEGALDLPCASSSPLRGRAPGQPWAPRPPLPGRAGPRPGRLAPATPGHKALMQAQPVELRGSGRPPSAAPWRQEAVGAPGPPRSAPGSGKGTRKFSSAVASCKGQTRQGAHQPAAAVGGQPEPNTSWGASESRHLQSAEIVAGTKSGLVKSICALAARSRRS